MDAPPMEGIGAPRHGSATGELGIPAFHLADLHRPARLRDLYLLFARETEAEEPVFWGEWRRYAEAPSKIDPIAASGLLIQMARRVSRFIARLFAIAPGVRSLSKTARDGETLFRFRTEFIRRRVAPSLKKAEPPAAASEEDASIIEALSGAASSPDPELAVARAGCRLLDEEARLKNEVDGAEMAEVRRKLEALRRWCAARRDAPGFRSWVAFHLPDPIDLSRLVPAEPDRGDPIGRLRGPGGAPRLRDGFTLTDGRMGARGVLGEAQYCLLCHERDKDSCSKGLRGAAGEPTRNVLGVDLSGCPLDEKISEMHALRREGDSLGALALVMIDNPLCPGTGHRICNDCMRSCIYQKQEPVDIPQVETGVLTDVLGLPWGVEI
jgi:hypothetical protein